MKYGQKCKVIATQQTWAYIQDQLDYPFSRQVKIHIIDGDKSLCGLKFGTWWESAEVENLEVEDLWLCKKCYEACRNKKRSERPGMRKEQ
jgi:hypothetical protein